MYGLLVRRRSEEMFTRLNRGEWKAIVEGLAEDVQHVFPGESPLGGERHTRAEVIRWFERLDHLFPGHAFRVHRVLSRGWPWNTWVAVQWSAEMRPAFGEPYENHGAHWIQIRWGKVRGFHAYLDTQRIADACAEMAEAGIAEASAPPIGFDSAGGVLQ
jgi:ketosteroid isomerase-like protein